MTLVYQAESCVPASRGDAFALAADIEAYPSFLPLCRATRITERRDNRLAVDNVFAFGPISARFHSHADLEPPSGLSVTSHDKPFRALHITWRFETVSPTKTRVVFRFEAEFHSAATEMLAKAVTDRLGERVLKAFEARLRPDKPSGQAAPNQT